jgi:bifunctional non-homologous end joining protein LigD
MQMEGIVSKSVEVLYRSGRNEAWLKIKWVRRAKFPIVGFVEDLDGVAAMHLAKRQGKDFVFVGKVDTGFNRKSSARSLMGS